VTDSDYYAGIEDLQPSSLADGGSGIVDPPSPLYSGKPCAEPGCDNPIPRHGEPGFGPARKKCDDHFVGSKHAGVSRPKKDSAPSNVKVDINLPKAGGGNTAADKRVKKVSAGATQMANTVAVLMTVGGDPVCGAAVAAGAAQWGAALGELSRYQPVLEKIFAPTGDVTGQGMAWLSVVAATAGIVIPVMAHHGLVSESLATKFAAGTIAATAVADTVDASATVAE
jgi:hypothetical protein